ncbi:hypothetical protein F4824DRAFT_269568 [Ustulina deusta]|nr:hypothetical protein F4824DRAFT_269568 [Ustulina deusta]
MTDAEEDLSEEDSSHPKERSLPAPVQDHQMKDRPAAVIQQHRPVRRRKTHACMIKVHQQRKKAKAKKAPRDTVPENRSSALTTFISNPQDIEIDASSQPNLKEDYRTITILLRRYGVWIEAKEYRRSSIIEAILEVRRDNPQRNLILYNKNSRGIALEDCPTHEDDFVCLNTDISGFPAELEL